MSALLAERGATIIDADVIAREVVAPGTPGLAEIRQAFGDGVLAPDGSLDRAALGRRAFANPAELATLNAIVHPLVGQETATRLRAAADAGARIVVFDVPLLVENHLQDAYDVVVVVSLDPARQLARLTGQRGMSAADAQARIAAQAPLGDKLAAATYVLRNDGEPAELVDLVDALWGDLSRIEETQPENPV